MGELWVIWILPKVSISLYKVTFSSSQCFNLHLKNQQVCEFSPCCNTTNHKRNQRANEDERGEWKCWLKTQHSKNKVMASSPITSWQIEVEKVEAETDFLSLGFKFIADGDCSHEIQRRLLLGRKAMTTQTAYWKAETLPTKVHIVKAMLFPVVIPWWLRW